MKTVLLLVEDDDNKARAIQRWIIREGIEVVRVTTMVMAVRTIREDSIDLVLTDWAFPLRDGDHVRDHAGQRVYDEAVKAGIPVAVFSGREEPVLGVEPWISSTNHQAVVAWLRWVMTKLELKSIKTKTTLES